MLTSGMTVMILTARCLSAWAAGLLFLGGTATAQQLPSKADIVKRAKTATAFVRIGFGNRDSRDNVLPQGNAYPGTGARTVAFCIHPSGLFITTERGLSSSGPTGELSVVLDPGQKKPRTLKATVVRRDKDLDLALLRAEDATDLPSLELGASDEVAELTELIHLGFPGPMAINTGPAPAVSVSTATVASLRRQGDELYRFHFNGAIDLGYVGGPLLDRYGKVVGVLGLNLDNGLVTAGVPSSHLRRFLSAPDFQFTPPAVTAANQHEPATFQARVTPLLPGTGPLTIELHLRAGNQPERRFKMDLVNETYRATAPPVPRPPEGTSLRVTVGYGAETLTGTVADRTFKVGDREFKLSEVRRLRGAPRPQVLLLTGKSVEGLLGGLDLVPVQLGGASVRVDLARAAEVRVEPAVNIDSVAYTLVALRAGKEVGRHSGTLPLRSEAAGARPLALEKTMQRLPAALADVALGGGGRFLILHLPSVRKLAVFDTQQAKIVRSIDVPAGDVKFAAGMDKLIVIFPSDNVIQRWDLTTFEREQSAPLPVNGVIRGLALGSASHGPLLLVTSPNAREWGRNTLVFLDPTTLKAEELGGLARNILSGAANRLAGEVIHVRASADGRVFGWWNGGLALGGINSLVILPGGQLEAHHVQGRFGHVVPGPDGKVLFTGAGLWTKAGKPLGELDEREGHLCIPAQQGGYYLSIPRANVQRFPRVGVGQSVERKTALGLCRVADYRPLVTVPDFPVTEPDPNVRHDFTFDKRIQFLPEAKLLVTIPPTNDQLVLHWFDVEKLLDQAGVDDLFVQSQPSAAARRGTTFTYALIVRSKRGGLTYKVELGPGGLAVSPTGKVTWQVPERAPEAEVPVVVSIRDAAGLECFHVFTLELRD
jgi:hypothetical protein